MNLRISRMTGETTAKDLEASNKKKKRREARSPMEIAR